MQSEVQKQTKKAVSRKAIVIALVVVIMLSIAITAQLAYLILRNDRVYSGVYINDVHVGGLTRQQVAQLLHSEYRDKIKDLEITIHAGDQSEILKFSDLDMKIDVEGTINEAFSIGRTGNIFERFRDILMARKNNPVIKVAYEYDKQKVDEVIESLYEKTLIPVKEADLLIRDDMVVVRSGHHGENIDKDLLLKEIENHIYMLKGGNINIPIDITMPAKIDVDDYYSKITREAQDAYVKVENNNVIIVPEVVGRSVKKSDLINIADELANKENTEKIIPIELVAPKLTAEDIRKNLFKDTLYTAYSSYKNDTVTNRNRTENLRLASSKINGKILAPGEVFSFNETVGKRTIEAGYKDAMVFKNGKVIPDIGGGICQVSSTLYNAVLYADLEVVERRNHMFVVSYVPYGLDSTVYYGQTDFRFKNSTNWPIMIKSWMTQDNKLYFSIIGTNETPNKTVEMQSEIIKTIPYTTNYTDDPNLPEGETKVIQTGYNGYVVDTYKIIKENGVVKERRKITTSTYQPLTEEILRGTKKVDEQPASAEPDSTTKPESPNTDSGPENQQHPDEENVQKPEQNVEPIQDTQNIQNTNEDSSQNPG